MIVVIELKNEKKPIVLDYICSVSPNTKEDLLTIRFIQNDKLYNHKLSEIITYRVYDNAFNTEIR